MKSTVGIGSLGVTGKVRDKSILSLAKPVIPAIRKNTRLSGLLLIWMRIIFGEKIHAMADLNLEASIKHQALKLFFLIFFFRFEPNKAFSRILRKEIHPVDAKIFALEVVELKESLQILVATNDRLLCINLNHKLIDERRSQSVISEV